jgi:hypothetical protein
MSIAKIIGSLRKPRFVASILFGSVVLSTLLTVADPAPLRRFLGMEGNHEASAPVPQTANCQPPSTNGVSSTVATKGFEKAAGEAPRQMIIAAKAEN